MHVKETVTRECTKSCQTLEKASLEMMWMFYRDRERVANDRGCTALRWRRGADCRLRGFLPSARHALATPAPRGALRRAAIGLPRGAQLEAKYDLCKIKSIQCFCDVFRTLQSSLCPFKMYSIRKKIHRMIIFFLVSSKLRKYVRKGSSANTFY